MYEQESEKTKTKTTSKTTPTGKIKNINDSLYYQVKFSEDLWSKVVVPKPSQKPNSNVK